MVGSNLYLEDRETGGTGGDGGELKTEVVVAGDVACSVGIKAIYTSKEEK